MTTVSFVSKKCYVCGHVGRQAEIGVREAGEPQDLDYRAGGVNRSSIYMWLQRCLSCGYVAPDIAVGSEAARSTVADESYRRQRNDTRYPDTINAFLCWGMIQEACGRFDEAAKAAIYAAWVCDDDADHRDKAKYFRERTLEKMDAAQKKGQFLTGDQIGDRLLMVDLLRRIGAFAKAAPLCAEELRKDYDEKTRTILLFQEKLIEDKDGRRHAIEEAFD
ncbi:MAG: hypothetical protein GF344_03145 [Chitinivibrionales bacterium]|nr:hypothetical protein [Chitinivibrionales bacterium]MBD3356075.1 hypothetical protein [Chitinivibrionales bacterium]